MQRYLRRLWIFGLVILTLSLGMASGIALDRQVLVASAQPITVPPDATREFQLMTEAWDTIQREYVDHAAAQPWRLAYGAISGMVDALGDTGHSRFLTPEMVQQEHHLTQGEFEGIGAEVQMKDGHVVIVAPVSYTHLTLPTNREV